MVMVYALRHEPSGKFVEAPTQSRRRALTHCRLKTLADAIPRLFATHRNARAALTWWCKGKITIRYGQFPEGVERWNIEPRNPQIVSDMKVVTMQLSVLPVAEVTKVSGPGAPLSEKGS